jgi:hypothetical protein
MDPRRNRGSPGYFHAGGQAMDEGGSRRRQSGVASASPAYAPELNPDEGVWQHLKHVELRNVCCINFAHLSIELNLAIRRLRRRSDLIRSFFAGAELDL